MLGAGFTGGFALGAGLIISGGIVTLLGRRMAAKTAEGSAVLAQSLGFKEYLVTAEAGQIEFEEASNVFSRYLPYAVVFGVADRWASTFAQVAQAAEAAGQTARHADVVPLERFDDAGLHEHRERGRLLLDDLDRHLHLDARLERVLRLLRRWRLQRRRRRRLLLRLLVICLVPAG